MSDAGSYKPKAVKGMNDVVPPHSAKWNFIEKRARLLFEAHGYQEVRVPIVEYTPLFVRSIGDATDVVEKEMYTFLDRDERSITMRPEGTAGAVRAYLEHSFHQKEPVTRWYYMGPMFRHERAQRGRYRQFYQLGCEAFGAGEATVDAEQIHMLYALYVDLGLTDLTVKVNSVGSAEDRPRYREALRAYFEPHRASLSEDSQRRLDRNPLRILDSKERPDQDIAQGAPKMSDYLGDVSRAHFDTVRRALDVLGVPHQVDTALVRGLDYYTGTVFELQSRAGDLGSQNTLGAGGRYDNLIRELGGPVVPAVGFALGVERLVLALPDEPQSYLEPVQVFFAPLGEPARLACLGWAKSLRQAGFRVELEHREGSLKSQLKRANKLNAMTVVVVGDSELAAGHVVLRNMRNSTQREVSPADLANAVDRELGLPEMA